MKRFVFLIFYFLCVAYSSSSQEYSIKNYRVDRGLPSDIIKSSIQDSLGYFWIATDEGLVKYDGIDFTTYRNVVHSNYTKGFFRTSKGKLLMFGDLDFLEIKSLEDTVFFRSVCAVSSIPNDTTLSYPKLVYEDRAGNLWIAESQSVVRLSQDGSFKRYAFSLSDRSPQFLRSFGFFEDKHGDLYTTSYQGNLFRHDDASDSFVSVDKQLPYGIEYISIWDDTLFIGANDGVYTSQLYEEGGISIAKQKIKVKAVSFITKLSQDRYLITTRGNQHFIGDIVGNNILPLEKSINSINHVYISKEKDIWLSGNDGWVLMHKNFFNSVDIGSTDFIESMTGDESSGLIYYATSQTLYSFDRKTKQYKVVLDVPGGYFQALEFTKDGLWIANAFKVFLFENGRIKEEYDFTKFGRFVTKLTSDSDGNIWLTIPGLSQAYYIDKQHDLKHINLQLGAEGVVNIIKEDFNGVYIGSAGTENYLLFKSPNDSVFRNVSVPIDNLKFPGQFNVFDLTHFDNRFWLATSAGVLELTNNQVKRADLGNRFTGVPVQFIQHDRDRKLITESPVGLVLYDVKNGTIELFNESCGLLSNTISPRGIYRAKDETLWVGTSKGLCFSINPLSKVEPSPQPRFIKVRADGHLIFDLTRIPYGNFISTHVSSITFPEEEVILQYRLHPDTVWSFTQQTEIGLSSLQSGNHTLEVRSKKNGPYSWSKPTLLNFTVESPFWENPWFYVAALLLAVALVFSTIFIMVRRNRKARERLQRMIDERTVQLVESNRALIQLNEEKNSLIGIVAHDLKSPLNQMMGIHNLIRVTTAVNDDLKKYLQMMEDSTIRLDSMIKKILDIDAIESKAGNVKMEKVDIADVVSRVTNRFANESSKKMIEILRTVPNNTYAYADASLFEQAFENLLSNAIKFSPREKKILVNVHETEDAVVCEVIDQGPGMTDLDKKKLFSKYQKLSAKPTGGESSTGLGLSIVKKYVTDMQGTISCQSEYGVGTTFTISLLKHT